MTHLDTAADHLSGAAASSTWTMPPFNQPARRKPGIQPKEQPMNRNAEFLASITQQAKTAIIDSIAGHYGITSDEAMDEVTDDEAENLLEYMVEPQRSAASVLMQKHGFAVK